MFFTEQINDDDDDDDDNRKPTTPILQLKLKRGTEQISHSS